jgi:hypothetical protein
MATLSINQPFVDIKSTKATIQRFLSDRGESWKVSHGDSKRFDICYKANPPCEFRIRATDSKKKGVAITHLILHTCNPNSHEGASNLRSIAYLLPHHRAVIIDNP